MLEKKDMKSKNPVDKATLLLKMLIWLLVLIITVAICIPGIIISLQYSGDPCIVGKQWNVRLDEWLLISALFHLVSLISFLPSICCVWKNMCSKIIPLIFVILLGIWACGGIFVMTISDLSSCSHDSLWVMSIIELVFVGIFIIIYSSVQFYSCCSCQDISCCNFCGWCNNDDPLDITSSNEDEDVAEWYKRTGLNTFAPLSTNVHQSHTPNNIEVIN